MTHTPPHSGADDSVRRGHETSDVHFKSVFVTGIGFLGIMVLGLLVSWGVYALFNQYTAAPGSHAETFITPDLGNQPPGPNLQADPHVALVAMRRIEDSVLTSYGWVSKDSGIVHIPIERAMVLIVERGLPSRETEIPR